MKMYVNKKDKKLLDCLKNVEGNYLLPFFWVHGEDDAILRREISKIDSQGIKAICVESRPHEDYLGEKWWHDLDIIIDEAKARNMKVWFFDDYHFPTGYAANRILSKSLNLRRLYLFRKYIDTWGPDNGSSFLISSMLQQDEQLLGVVAAKRSNENDNEIKGQLINLTKCISHESYTGFT
jgi:phosphatidylserine/phosphatidylglycerophosphate/cardiolipin synthase-like enzyme